MVVNKLKPGRGTGVHVWVMPEQCVFPMALSPFPKLLWQHTGIFPDSGVTAVFHLPGASEVLAATRGKPEPRCLSPAEFETEFVVQGQAGTKFWSVVLTFGTMSRQSLGFAFY